MIWNKLPTVPGALLAEGGGGHSGQAVWQQLFLRQSLLVGPSTARITTFRIRKMGLPLLPVRQQTKTAGRPLHAEGKTRSALLPPRPLN